MAPPRFQCLNSMRKLAKGPSGLRATFSTSQASCAPGDSHRALPSQALLDSLGEQFSPRRLNEPVDFTNPIKSPKSVKSARNATESLVAMYASAAQRKAKERAMQREGTSLESGDLEKHNLNASLSKLITRPFRPGDVYAPHDLSGVEMEKWRKRQPPTHDAFDILAFNPLEHYRNFSVMSEYMTPMGKIKHSSETGLRPVNQRKVAKAIRRAIGMGMMPSVHRHPEILYKQAGTRLVARYGNVNRAASPR